MIKSAIQHLREFITDNLTLTSEEYYKIYYRNKKVNKRDNKVNEKTIIGGVDVSGCKYFGNCDNRNCEGDCYYKQLKKAEQENERLKSIIESNKQELEQAELDNDRLQKEVQALRRQFY